MLKLKVLSAMVFMVLSYPLSVIPPDAKATAVIKQIGAVIVDVPMQYRGHMPAMEVKVNGKGPFLFAIDTGGMGQARLDISLAERLDIKPTGKVQAGDGTGANSRTFDTVQLESLAIGSLQFSDVRAMVRDYNTSPNLSHIDGILGFNLFKDYLLTLDYPGARIRIERGALPASDGSEILNLDKSSPIPAIDITVGGLEMKAHLDAGNMGGMMLPASMIEKLKLATEPKVVGRAKTVTNEFEIKGADLNGTLRLGRHEIQNPTITFAEIFRGANVGSKVMREFALTFDQKNHRVRIVRRNPTG